MVDIFALGIPHLLLALAAWRLLLRDDLDNEPPPPGIGASASPPVEGQPRA